MAEIIVKWVTYNGKPMIVACDALCKKAWGINRRPTEQISQDEDDYAFLADHELGQAPRDPGTYEGRDAKPQHPSERLNKWCVRECERSVRGRPDEALTLPDFSQRVYNIPSSRPTGTGNRPTKEPL